MKRMLKKFWLSLWKPLNLLRYGKKQKIFCIGKNKTGTTSAAVFLDKLGIRVAPQWPAELLIKDWAKGDFKKIIEYVRSSGVAFQDIPFSLPNTFEVMDKEFENSKFILTIRDSAEIWYGSLTSFHSKLFGNGNLPTKEVLQQVDYMYPGFAWECNRLIHDTPESDPYNKEILIRDYHAYNESVIKYFENKPEKLLVVNLKEENASRKIIDFIGYSGDSIDMPWANKT